MDRRVFAPLLLHLVACPSRAPAPPVDEVAAVTEAPATPAPTETAPTETAPTETGPASEALAPCEPERAQDGALSAGDLNTLGYRCYRAGRLDDALDLFRVAVERDDGHALAHYNLACTLARLRALGEICEHDAYVGVILDHLERSVALDEGRRARMREDADLDGIRATVRYQVLDGADLSREEDLRRVLEAATFWGPAAGVYGNATRLDLQPGARAVLETLSVGEDTVGWEPATGSWTVRGGELELEIGEKSWTYLLLPTGELTNRDGVGFTDTKSECEA